MDERDDQNNEIVSQSKPQLKVIAQIPEDDAADSGESSSENQPVQSNPKRTLRKLGTAPAISVNRSAKPRVKPKTQEQKASSGKTAGDTKISSLKNQLRQVAPQKSLKKLGTVAAAPVNKSARPGIMPKTRERKVTPSLGGGASGKAKLEAMGIKFKKKDDAEPTLGDASEPKPPVKPPPPKPKPPGIPSAKTDEKKAELAKDSSQTYAEELLETQEKNKAEPLSLKTVFVPRNISSPPTALTHTLFGIWCLLFVVLAGLFIMQIISL